MGTLNTSAVTLWLIGLATLLLAQTVGASAETRVLKFYHLHTHERATIAYKRDGRYLPDGLKKINHILRDWRQNQEVKINPRLLDLVWQAYRMSGSRDYINVICGYRAPETNSMLRRRSNGVAKKSQHMLGNALDFYLPDVKLSKLRAIGLKLQDGGVGYYPTSGSPFVHMDVGNVRHWPRMSRSQLLALFPDGKTVHIPSDGKPLAGYNVALASYKSRVSNDVIVAGGSSSSGPRKGILASLFGGGVDEEEDRSGIDDVPAQQRTTTVVASVPRAAATPEPQASQPEGPATILAALPERAVPVPRIAPRPDVDVGNMQTASVVASAEAPADSAAGETAEAKFAALDVPLPQWRPAYSPPAAAREDEAKVVAVADIGGEGEPIHREATVAGDAIADILKANPRPEMAPTATAYLPLPGERPTYDQPSARTIALSSAAEKFADTLATDDNLMDPEAGNIVDAPKMAMISTRTETRKPADFFSGAKTTPKGSRVSAADEKPDAQSVVIPVRAETARWALRGDTLIANADAAMRPGFDAALIQAPAAVYTAGFRKETEMADAGRFTGNAVKFMSVARFATD